MNFLSQMTSVGIKLVNISEEMQRLSNRASSINSTICNCYEAGGVGGLVNNASANMKRQANLLKYYGEVVIQGDKIYAEEEERLKGESSTAVSKVETGTDIAWLARPTLQSIFGPIGVTVVASTSGLGKLWEAIWGEKETTITSPDISITGGNPRYIDLSNNDVKINKSNPSTTGVKTGEIRFIKQTRGYDKDAWPASVNPKAGCIAAAKSMALSSMGIDHLPKDMNLGSDGYVNNDNIPLEALDLKVVAYGDKKYTLSERNNALDECLANYISDPSKYSPPIIRVKTYGGGHSMIVTGLDENGYKVVDSGGFGAYVNGIWITWDHYTVSTDGSVSAMGSASSRTGGDSHFFSELVGVSQYVKNA